MEVLLNSKPKIDMKGYNDYTPLHLASEYGHLEAVKCLQLHGASLEERTKSGETSFALAYNNMHYEICSYLAKYGVNVANELFPSEKLYVDHTNYGNMLLKACLDGRIDAVNCLVEMGAPLDSINEQINTPLHVAILNGHDFLSDFLIRKGAKINETNIDNSTPLHIAAEKGFIEVVKNLINHGALLEPREKNGFTPLHLAAKNGWYLIVECLTKTGASIKEKITPLNLAVENGHHDIAEFLMDSSMGSFSFEKLSFKILWHIFT